MKFVLASIILGAVASGVRAEAPVAQRTLIERDRTYEENLRWEASDDKAMTPTRAIRWIRGVRGAAIFAPVKPAEFQPIVNVQDSYVRAVATLAFKF